MAAIQRLRAKWIINSDGTALDGGVVTIENGTIAALESGGAANLDLGDVAILPGLVNAHVHLDLSSLEAPDLPRDSFPSWLLAVIAHRRSAPSAEATGIIAKGLAQLAGTTLVGDISADGWSKAPLQTGGLAGVVFREVLGLRPQRYEGLWEGATRDLGSSTSGVTFGVSPHAPYSTAREVYHRAAMMKPRCPVATHWFETPEEVEFLHTGKGPFREFLEAVGAWTDTWQPTDDPWNDYFPAVGTARWILIHGNCLSAGDIENITRPSMRSRFAGIVYCPRTHAHFRRPPHPYRALRAAGFPVGLGTDSLASNPDLSVFEEAKFLAAHDSEVSPLELLQMLTADGAAVLGRGDEWGSLSVGKRADLAVIALAPGAQGKPLETIFASETKVLRTMAAGQWVDGPVEM